jgi:hypothetical protein
MVHPAKSICGLYKIFAMDASLVVGGCASLSNLQAFCHDLMMIKAKGGGISPEGMT